MPANASVAVVSRFGFRRALPLAVLAFLMAGGCGRRTAPPLERIVIPPFENLTSDPDLDWLSLAIPGTLAMSRGSATRILLPVGREEHNVMLRATLVLQGYFLRNGSGLALHAQLRDPVTQKRAGVFALSGRLEDTGALLADLARKLEVSDFPPPSLKALEFTGRALQERDPERQATALYSAVLADPKYTPAILLRARVLAGVGQRGAALEQLRAGAEVNGSAWHKAQLQTLQSQLAGSRAEQRAAFEALLKESPVQTDAMRQLAKLLQSEGRYRDAAAWLQKAAALEPEVTETWNLLAYAHAYDLRFDDSKKAVERYLALTPQDPNAYDTAGEMAWMAGDFAEAERRFLEAQAKAPEFLGGMEFYRAALARFLRGDKAGADEMFRRFMESRKAASDPRVELKQAHWLWLTGRKPEARQEAEKLASGNGEAASQAGILYALLLVREGEREKAAEWLRGAVAKTKTPALLAMAGSVAFLAQPKASPTEWQSRAERVISPQTPSGFRQLMLLYAFVLDEHWSEAARVADGLLKDLPPEQGDEVRVLGGWAHGKAGNAERARQLLRRLPLPPPIGDAFFAGWYVPAFTEWRKQAGV